MYHGHSCQIFKTPPAWANVKCECCSRILSYQLDRYPFAFAFRRLRELGVGIPLFFQFKCFLVWFMVIMLPASFVGLYFCLTAQVHDPDDRWTEERFIAQSMSVGSLGRSIEVQDPVVIIMLSMHIGTIIAISFMYRHFRVR